MEKPNKRARRIACACLALALGAILLPAGRARAEEWPQPLPIDLDSFCRQNCVSSYLALRGKVTLKEVRAFEGWECSVTNVYRNTEDGAAWWTLAEYTGDEYLRRFQGMFLPGAVPQRLDLTEETDGHRTLSIYSPHSAEGFSETYLVYGYNTQLDGYGKLYLGEGTSDGQTDTWEIFATLADPFYASAVYEVSRRTGWIERASATTFQNGSPEETWTLETAFEADGSLFSRPGCFQGEEGTVSVTLCIGHENNTEETLTYSVLPGTEIVYVDYEDFTAYRDAEKTDRLEGGPMSVSFGEVSEDVTFYISAI